MERIKKFFNDESGATLGEYCMLVVLIAAVMWGSIKFIDIFTNR
jgi:Flp pilus assembly pilin Flp